MPDEMMTYELRMMEARDNGDDIIRVRHQEVGGVKFLTIPKAWKITFGPICPGAKNVTLCVRVYEGKALRAVIPNVAYLSTPDVILKDDVGAVLGMNKEAPKRKRKEPVA